MNKTELKKYTDELEEHTKSQNFVYAVGYSLEKVHSGILCNLLNSDHGSKIASAFWNKVSDLSQSGFETIPAEDIEDLKAVREYKIAKRTVADLIISFEHSETGEKHHIVCEYKVDGTVEYEDQCKRIRKAWMEVCPDKQSAFVFVTTGGSRFWTPPDEFAHIDIPHLKKILGPCEEDVPLLTDYFLALDDELLRRTIVEFVVDREDEDMASLGYRRYDIYYAYYDVIRNLLNREEWQIESGGRNPVMSWRNSWGCKNDEFDELKKKNIILSSSRIAPSCFLYCEFNYLNFYIKVKWPEGPEYKDKHIDREVLLKVRDAAFPKLGKFEFDKTIIRSPKTYSSLAYYDLAGTSLDDMKSWINNFIQNGFISFCDDFVPRIKSYYDSE